MKHKIFILFFLGLFLCLSFSACESEQSVWRIGVSQCSDDAWRTQLNREIEREALFYPGVSLEFKSAHDDSQQQIKDTSNPQLSSSASFLRLNVLSSLN